MKDLLSKYTKIKTQAVTLMQTGQVNAYLKKLAEAQQLQLQITQLRILG